MKTRRQKCLCIIVYFGEEKTGEGKFVSISVLCIKMNKLLSATFFFLIDFFDTHMRAHADFCRFLNGFQVKG